MVVNMNNNPYIMPLAQRATGYGYIVERETYKICYLNPPHVVKLGKKTGKTEQELEGTLCYETIFGKNAPCEFCKMNKIEYETPKTWYLNHEIDGCHYIMYSFLTKDEKSDYFLQMTSEITDEINEIENLKISIEAEQMITSCAYTLFKDENKIEEILEIICSFFGASGAYVQLDNSENSIYNQKYTFFNDYCEKIADIDFSEKQKEISELFYEKEYVFLEEDLNLTNNFGEFSENMQTKNLLMSNITINEKNVGMLVLHNISQKFMHFDKISTIKSFIINDLMLKKRIITLKEQNDLAYVVLNCVETLESEKSFEEAVHDLLSIICGFFECDRSYILKKVVNSLEIEFEKVFTAPNSTKMNEIPQESINEWFDTIGKSDTLSVFSTESLIGKNPKYKNEYEILLDNGINSFLGVRLYENGVFKRFLLIDNPKVHTLEVDLLKNVAFFVESHLVKGNLLKKLEELSYTDSLTGLYNRNFYNNYLNHINSMQGGKFGVIFADVNGLKRANDNFGHEIGDILIKWSANSLKDNLGGMIFRIGGDEFVCFIEDITQNEFQQRINKLMESLKSQEYMHISIGYSYVEGDFDINNVIKVVDDNMYEDKKEYYKQKALDTRSVKQELQEFKKHILTLNTDNENNRNFVQ